MKNSKEKIIRYALLILGIFFVGLGIALAKRSGLGISPVSSVANVISLKFPVLSVGTWLMLWNCFMVLLQVAILRKAFKLIQLLQFPISLLLGVFTDACVFAVSIIPVELYVIRLLLVILGVLVLALGIVFMMLSDTVMNVGEALVKVLSDVLKKDFGNVKIIFDICCVTLSAVLSILFFDFKVVGIREGTLITACFTGTAVKLIMKAAQKTKLYKNLKR